MLNLFLLLLACASSQQNSPVQSLQGKVIEIHLSEQYRYLPGPAGGQGVSVKHKRQVYRVETLDRFYLLEGGREREFDIGTQIEFRMDKGFAWIHRGKKERKFRMVGEELKK